MVNDSSEAGDRKNKIAALNSLTKLFGHDAPIRQDINHTGLVLNYLQPKSE